MRPPRPWPSWRRARSRSTDSRSSSSPAGRPSTIVVRPGPWDSPAVTMRSGTPRVYSRGVPVPLQELEAAQERGDAAPELVGAGALGGGARDPHHGGLRAVAGLRGANRGGQGPLGGVDRDHVELVGRGHGARVVEDVEELGLTGAQVQRAAARARAVALAVARGLEALVEQELGRLA